MLTRHHRHTASRSRARVCIQRPHTNTSTRSLHHPLGHAQHPLRSVRTQTQQHPEHRAHGHTGSHSQSPCTGLGGSLRARPTAAPSLGFPHPHSPARRLGSSSHSVLPPRLPWPTLSHAGLVPQTHHPTWEVQTRHNSRVLGCRPRRSQLNITQRSRTCSQTRLGWPLPLPHSVTCARERTHLHGSHL